MELRDAVENLLSKEALPLSEVQAGQKQGVELQGSRCWSSLGAELTEGSSRRGRTLEGAQVWQHCSPLLAQGSSSSANTAFIPPQARRRLGQRRMNLKHIFLCFPKLPELPMCFSFYVLVS